MSKLLTEGMFRVAVADESGEEYVLFTEPLEINFSVYRERPEEPAIAYIQYDFGMKVKLIISDESQPFQETIEDQLEADILLAFNGSPTDLGYTFMHWAIYGWLKNRAHVVRRTNMN